MQTHRQAEAGARRIGGSRTAAARRLVGIVIAGLLQQIYQQWAAHVCARVRRRKRTARIELQGSPTCGIATLSQVFVGWRGLASHEATLKQHEENLQRTQAEELALRAQVTKTESRHVRALSSIARAIEQQLARARAHLRSHVFEAWRARMYPSYSHRKTNVRSMTLRLLAPLQDALVQRLFAAWWQQAQKQVMYAATAQQLLMEGPVRWCLSSWRQHTILARLRVREGQAAERALHYAEQSSYFALRAVGRAARVALAGKIMFSWRRALEM